MEKIEGFLKYEHIFLSNFHPSVIEFEDGTYRSVEAAYQAAKTEDVKLRRQFQGVVSPGKCKRLGKKLELRPGWDNIKEGVMLTLLREKFKIPELREKLLRTGDAYIEETNWWGDEFWGVCRGKGLNRLGHLLMQVREEVKSADRSV